MAEATLTWRYVTRREGSIPWHGNVNDKNKGSYNNISNMAILP